MHNILSNETYAGVWHYGKKKKISHDGIVRTTEVRRRPKDEWIPVEVPAIIDRELWKAAQLKLAENRKKAAKPTRRKYLLRGRIKCALCGCRLRGLFYTTRKSGEIGYYRCRRHDGEYHDIRCDLPVLRQDAMEAWVWHSVTKVLLDPDHLFEGLRAKREEAERELKVILDAIAVSETQIEKAQRKLERLLELYLESDIPKEDYSRRKSKLEERIEELELEKDNLEAQLARQGVVNEETEAQAKAFCQQVAIGLERVTFEDKLRILDLLNISLVTNGETITLTGLIPTQTLDVLSITSARDGGLRF